MGVFSAAFLGLASAVGVSGKLAYEMIDVSQLDGPSSVTIVKALDDMGRLAGHICDAPPYCSTMHWDAFFWDGAVHRFKVPEGLVPYVATTAGGRIAGSLRAESGLLRPFVSEGPNLVELETLGGSYSVVWAMNASGILVGESALPTGEKHAVVWRDGAIEDLAPRTGRAESRAMAVDDAGNVAVLACDRLGYSDNCRVLIATGEQEIDLGSTPDNLYALAMTPDGRIAAVIYGWWSGSTSHAAIWEAGETTDLDAQIRRRAWEGIGVPEGDHNLNSRLNDMAASGDAVGEVVIPISKGGASTAMLVHGGEVIELQDLLDTPNRVFSGLRINRNGQILATRSEFGPVVLLNPR